MVLTQSEDSPPPLPPRHAPVYTHDDAHSSDLSSLYGVLPSVVKSRLPVLPSIRRSVAAMTTLTQSKSIPSPPQTPKESQSRNRADSGTTYECSDDELATRERDWQLARREAQSGSATPQASSHLSVEFGLLPPNFETRSGVDWNTATPGIMLLNNARYQSVRQLGTDPATLRSLHVDGLTYLIRALPKNLTLRELQTIDNVLPEQLHTFYLTNDHQAGARSSDPQSAQDQNILRRYITYTIIQIALFISFVLPLLTAMLNRAVRYERDHQLTERAVTKGIVVAETVGVRGLDLKENLIKLSRGRLGGAVLDAGAWFLGGVAGGLSDGMGRGMMVIAQAVMSSPPPQRSPNEL